jgi:hypothetical protein
MLTTLSNCPVPIVGAQHLDPRARLAGPGLPVADVAVLLVADRRGGHAATVLARCMARESAPPAADLQDTVARTEIQHATETIDLPGLGALEGVAVRLEIRRRVHLQRGVEKQAEELVAEVVVMMDVTPAPGARVVAGSPRRGSHDAPERPGEAALAIEHVTVPQGQPGDGYEVRRRPVAVHVRLAHADVRAGQRAAEEARVVDDDRTGQIRRTAVPVRARGTLHDELAVAQTSQAAEKEPLRPSSRHSQDSFA